MVRLIYTLTYIWISIIFVGCNGETTSLLGGDREASLSLNPVSKEFTLTMNDPKKLVMVIIADPTGSMVSTIESVRRSIPGFTKGLVDTDFTFDIYCTTTSYNGGSDAQIISIKSSIVQTTAQLQQSLDDCINVVTEDGGADERGLEAAKKAWENILSKGLVTKDAVKLTMIITNEDDCSRDLGQYPSGPLHNCRDQNVGFSTLEGASYFGEKQDMTERAYADDTRLFQFSRYVDFFQERLNYVSATAQDELDEVLIQRGHIFAPVIMPPPAAVGLTEAERCKDVKTAIGNANGNKIMSYGMRYYQVAEASNNPIYSLCNEFSSIFDEINQSVQNEVKERKFVLSRIPSHPENLQIQIRRNISDVSLAESILQRMDYENSRVSEANKWVKTEEKASRVGNKNVTTQKWSRTLNYGIGFTYIMTTRPELVFDDSIYQPFNDKLRVMSYAPAGLDGEANYDQ